MKSRWQGKYTLLFEAAGVFVVVLLPKCELMSTEIISGGIGTMMKQASTYK